MRTYVATIDKLYGSHATLSIQSSRVLAHMYMELQSYTHALPLLNTIVTHNKSLSLSSQSDDMSDLAMCYIALKMKKQYNEAETLLLSALRARASTLGEYHPTLLPVYLRLVHVQSLLHKKPQVCSASFFL
jgi:hypothetical protein